jgi:hypothetical protein
MRLAVSNPVCESHPEAVATFQCEACEKYLCAECAEEGHRLFFCALCGERALPLAAEAPTTTNIHREVVKRDAPYGLQDALAYPFRGLGGYVYWAYVILLIIFMAIGIVPGGGCLILIFQLLILLTLPGLLFSIVRTSSRGDVELPDWPDWTDVGERLFEWFGAMLAFLAAMIPAVVAVLILGCGTQEFLEGTNRCSLGLAGGLILGAAIWIPAFGSVALTFSPWWALRIDLHVRALFEVGAAAWKTFGLLVALLAARVVASWILAPIPVLGAAIQIAIGIYTLFLGAHLIGLLFRRHADTLEAIYS